MQISEVKGQYDSHLGSIDHDLSATHSFGEGHHGQTGCRSIFKLKVGHLEDIQKCTDRLTDLGAGIAQLVVC